MADTTSPDLLGRLAAHRLLGGAPPGEHAWLVAHGTLQRYPVGTVLVAKGTQAHELTILFSGRLVTGRTGAGARPELQKGTTPLVKLQGGKATRDFRNYRHPPLSDADYLGPRAIIDGDLDAIIEKLIRDQQARHLETKEKP